MFIPRYCNLAKRKEGSIVLHLKLLFLISIFYFQHSNTSPSNASSTRSSLSKIKLLQSTTSPENISITRNKGSAEKKVMQHPSPNLNHTIDVKTMSPTINTNRNNGPLNKLTGKFALSHIIYVRFFNYNV